MASLLNPNVRILVLVSEPTEFGRFDDALRFTPAEFDAMDDDEVESLAATRVAAWVATVRAARDNPPPAPTLAERIAARDALAEQLAAAEADLNAT